MVGPNPVYGVAYMFYLSCKPRFSIQPASQFHTAGCFEMSQLSEYPYCSGIQMGESTGTLSGLLLLLLLQAFCKSCRCTPGDQMGQSPVYTEKYQKLYSNGGLWSVLRRPSLFLQTLRDVPEGLDHAVSASLSSTAFCVLDSNALHLIRIQHMCNGKLLLLNSLLQPYRCYIVEAVDLHDIASLYYQT